MKKTYPIKSKSISSILTSGSKKILMTGVVGAIGL